MVSKVDLLIDELRISDDNLGVFIELLTDKPFSELYDDSLPVEDNYQLIIPFIVDECFAMSKYLSGSFVSGVIHDVAGLTDSPVEFFYYLHHSLNQGLNYKLGVNH